MSRSAQSNTPTQRAQAISEFFRAALNFRLPIFLGLCLLLGGTSQDIIAPKAVLYGLSLGVIAWVITQDGLRTQVYPAGLERLINGPMLILSGAILVFLIYLLPLPADIWTGLPGRDFLVLAYNKIGIELPHLPLSLTPDITFNSLFDFLPPLAVLMTVALTRSGRELTLTLYAIIFVIVLSFPIGLIQSVNPGQFQFYEISNIGAPVGFFSNMNHQAIFSVMSVPLAIYIASRGYRRLQSDQDGVPKIAMAVMAFIIMLTLVLLAESFAVFSLLIAAVVLSLPMVFSAQIKRPKVLMAIVVIFAVFAAATILKAGDLQSFFADKLSASESISRESLQANTVAAIRSMGWAGSGPGSFYDVYLLYENRATMTTTFANQAHNDVLQLVLELGVFGIGLMTAFVIWFVSACVKGAVVSRPSRKLILILLVSTLVVVLHSFVDYPIRTIGLASFTAFNIGYVSRLLRP